MDKNPSTRSVGWWSSRRKVIGRSRWMNIQQSGGTGRSSLWMECCQFALRVWTEAWVFKFPVTVLVAVLGELLPLYSRQDQQFQNRIQNVHLQSSVISWQALLGHRSTSWKSGTLEFMVVAPVKSVSTPITADTSRTPILDICVLSWNFKLLSSSWFVSLSPEESLLTPQSYRVFWGTSRFNYKRAKTNTVFFKTVISLERKSVVSGPLVKGIVNLFFRHLNKISELVTSNHTKYT